IAPEIGRRAASASRVFPFRLGEQTIRPAGHLGEPRRILPGVVPTDIDDRPGFSPKTTVVNLRASPYRDAGVPFGERHVELRNGEGLGGRDRVLWAFIGLAALLSRGRSHREAARRHDDHLGAVLRAFPERIPRLQRALGGRSKYVGMNLRAYVGLYDEKLTQLLSDVRLVDPANEPNDDTDQQDNGNAGVPRSPFLLALALCALINEIPINHGQIVPPVCQPALRLVQREAHEQRAALRLIRRGLPRTARGFEPAAPGQEFALGGNPVA